MKNRVNVNLTKLGNLKNNMQETSPVLNVQ